MEQMFYEKGDLERARLPVAHVWLLSAREQEVLVQMARGLDNRQIAARLFITRNTLSHHITRIYAKLGAANRAQAILCAIRAGLVDPHLPET
jgi:DNA-binding NarL/FixJ family response regulator